MPRKRSIVPAIIVGAGIAAAIVIPPSLPWSASPDPTFPRTVGSYSWWTTPLSSGDLDRATVLYQNGVGVEFMDSPQAVVLGADGSTYRRLSVAEGRSTPADQGDPAKSVLSPDGTFAVVGSGVHAGIVTVVDLATGAARDLPIGDDLAAVPQGIAGDGRTVLLLVGESPMSRYQSADFSLSGTLLTLDLETGAVADLQSDAEVNAGAISPDGRFVLVSSASGAALLDTATGRMQERADLGRESIVGGSAFAPSSSRFATSDGLTLAVHGTLPGGNTSSWPLTGFEYAYPVGWRDDGTVLVQGGTDGDANTSALAWVDVESGEIDVFSTYTPDITGAAMWITSVAADLIPQWTVADARNDRGIVPLALGLGLGVAAGALAWVLTPRRRTHPVAEAIDDVVATDERVSV